MGREAAVWVSKVLLQEGFNGAVAGFSSEDLGTLVAATGPSLTELYIGWGFDELDRKPFWKSLQDSVVPAELLRSLVIQGTQRFS
jgi:hypothetical protein